MDTPSDFNEEFFALLTENREDLLGAWVEQASEEQRKAGFLQAVRMGWMPGVKRLVTRVDQKTVDHGLTFAVVAHDLAAVDFLAPLATSAHCSGAAIESAAHKGAVRTVELLVSHTSRTIKNGVLAGAAAKGQMEIVRLVRPLSTEMEVNNALVAAAKEGRSAIVQELLPHCLFTNYRNGALVAAAKNGWVDTVDVLLPVCDAPGVNNALSHAAAAGYIDVVRQLVAHCDPKASNSLALRAAAQNGYVECVELLIPLSDPLSNNSAALREAAANGHLGCVKKLLPVSNPKETPMLSALYWALGHGQDRCAEYLYRFSDPLAVLWYLENEKEPKAKVLSEMMARRQKQTLHQQIAKRRGDNTEAEVVRRKL